EMSDQGSGKCHQSCKPMMRVEMVSGGNLNHFLSPGKLVRQPMEQIEAADNEAHYQSRERGPKQEKQQHQQAPRSDATGFDRDWSVPEPIKPQAYEGDGD